MTTKTHALFALVSCYAACMAVYANSTGLIGLLHGPSHENNALDHQQSVRTKLLSIARQSGEEFPWAWVDIETADSVLGLYGGIAYQDHSALVLRDAGVIAALLAMILALVPNFSSIFYSTTQRLFILMMVVPLYITAGFVGQIVFEKTIPFEIALLKTLGLERGLSYIGYCSLQSLLIGLGDGPPILFTLIHELQVVLSAGLIVFILLGVMPPGK